MVAVGVVGGSGYSGKELVRLLKRHPGFTLVFEKGRDFSFTDYRDKVELVFLCTPNETSLELAPKFLAAGVHVVDLSGAFRLKEYSYETWYGFKHNSRELLDSAEYGLFPWKKIEPAVKGQPRLIANPGCFTTTVLMGLIPLLKKQLVNSDFIYIDAKSGTTGAGRKADIALIHAEVSDDISPYKVGRHQHWPELVEAISQFTNVKFNPVFVTELLPVTRGISAAIFSEWGEGAVAKTAGELREGIESFYKNYPDIVIYPEGKTASLKNVTHTNEVHISVHEAYGRPVIFIATDNLLRGAAGQALMNANLLVGFNVNEGL